MNKESVLAFLQHVLGPVAVAPQFIKELSDLITGTGVETKVFKILTARLKALRESGASAVRYKEFEPLKGEKLFSMHLTGKGFNIRILYSLLPSQQPVLLLAFYEREDSSITNYSSYTPTAQDRLAAFRKEFEK